MIVATDGHPFWVPDLGLWVDAIDLAPGMWLQTSSGTWVQVSAIQAWTQSATVHNLTVQGVHTYHVAAGDLDVLNHNCNTTVYRKQTDHPDSQRLSVDGGGNVSHQGDGRLYLNMSGDVSHSQGFRGSGGTIVAFDVPSSVVDGVVGSALPQRMPRGYSGTKKDWKIESRNSPELSDPKVSPGLIGLPSGMIDGFMARIVPGSGRLL